MGHRRNPSISEQKNKLPNIVVVGVENAAEQMEGNY